jgi:hypothetical protein
LVDHKNDRFECRTGCYLGNDDPAREVTSHIAQYILWVEHENDQRSTAGLEKSVIDDWYFVRISWLHRLLNVLEISPAKINDSMRSIRTSHIESKYRPIDVEESIKHFLQSWEIQEGRRVAALGEAEPSPGT